MTQATDIIGPDEAGTLAALLRERVRRSPPAEAYRQFEEASGEWVSWSWKRFASVVSRWRQALVKEGFKKGDRVAVMSRNCREWAAFDLAAQGLGLVIVPLYVNDRPDNLGLVLQNAGARLLLVENGDRARIEEGYVFITGRMKEIIVLANGEKVPLGDMEMAIALDRLFSQVMVIGEGKPYLAALVVLNPKEYPGFASGAGLADNLEDEQRSEQLEKLLVTRVAERLRDFPGYAAIRRVGVATEPWTIDNGLMTPTLKLRRERILQTCNEDMDRLYAGH